MASALRRVGRFSFCSGSTTTIRSMFGQPGAKAHSDIKKFIKKNPSAMFPYLGMFAATFGCVCMYHLGKASRAKEKGSEARFVLYQYSNCPFCSKVRSYLHYSGQEFDIVEVNPITKEEAKAVTTYKKVPILVADGVVLKESSLITSILHTHFTTGQPISEIIPLYPAVDTGIEDVNSVHVPEEARSDYSKWKQTVYDLYCKVNARYAAYKQGKEKVEYHNKYRIMGYDENKHEEMMRVARMRRWGDNHFVHLISPNVYRTWKESLQAFDYFTANGNFTEFQKTYIRYIGAGAMYLIGKRLRKRHNLDHDVRIDLYSGINHWLRSFKGGKFHGGEDPDLADLDMYGMCSSFYGMPCWEDAISNTKLERWYNRMERKLEKRSAIGLVRRNSDAVLAAQPQPLS